MSIKNNNYTHYYIQGSRNNYTYIHLSRKIHITIQKYMVIPSVTIGVDTYIILE